VKRVVEDEGCEGVRECGNFRIMFKYERDSYGNFRIMFKYGRDLWEERGSG
jgi:hypothetical protein